MENSMDRYLGQMLDNRYEILEMIGTGGMAVVFKALCHRLNRYVAIKILKDEYARDEEFREHFKAESQAVAMLSHPNIVAVYDFSKSPDCQYIVMELLEGITLKQYMQKKGALSWKEALHFATQISKALSHAHEKGIVHRDIKPQNIMVGKDGSIKVADFGIAHLQNESNPDSCETMGSIHYISPEQARGEAVDARSDIYSLGIVMYEMLTGRLPYEGDSVEAIAVQHFGSMLTLPGDINPEIPLRLEQITLRAMTSDINARYQSADQLLDDLEDFRKHQQAGDPADTELVEAVSYDSDSPANKIRPLGRTGELSVDDYKRRKIRSRKVSTFSGIALVGIFLMAVVAFLWNYWIKDIFVDTQRVIILNFVGEQYDEIINSSAYKGLYNFEVAYTIDPDAAEGEIVAQSPEAGRSVAPTSDGIDIKLTVSTGLIMTEIPDLVNHEYREATLALERLGFVVDPRIVASDSITEEYVVSTVPAGGEKAPAGTTVVLNISGGPDLVEFEMPRVIGKTQSAAMTLLTESGLTIGSISETDSNEPVGTVIWQSIDEGTMVTKNTVVYLKVSKGPAVEESPSPPPSDTPTDTPTEPPTDSPVTPPPVDTSTPPPPTTPVEGGE